MNEIPQTRASLLLRLGNQSQDAWPEFLAIYESALYGFCRAKGLQDADAHDVLQDVLTAVITKLPDWDPDSNKGSFRGWLFRVARNIAVDQVKRKAKEGRSDRLPRRTLDGRRRPQFANFCGTRYRLVRPLSSGGSMAASPRYSSWLEMSAGGPWRLLTLAGSAGKFSRRSRNIEPTAAPHRPLL